MNQKSHNFPKYAELFGAVCGGLLISVAAIPQVVLAQQLNSQVNRCPRIFYEEPHNNRVLVPQGCPPNALTQRLLEQGLIPESPNAANPSPDQTGLGVGGEAPGVTNSPGLNPNPNIFQEAPYNRSQGALPNPSTPAVPDSGVQTPPRQQQSPIATITPTNGTVNVRLVNNTAANVTYEVIGDTAPRSLQGKSNAILQGLSIPTTVTFYREDGGLLTVTPQITSQQGILEVTLRETTAVGRDRGVMRITENGGVFLN
ncbi:hypothetical protein [Calothrix sp. PCC 7507]|uniref:hypothetical protein n=1 Tax=Calothrix sp. PCC 7507 TaxID=99598 RepID=UPI0002E1E357|nr:hypothetical protein [Calothrix sp. PCC 7507]